MKRRLSLAFALCGALTAGCSSEDTDWVVGAATLGLAGYAAGTGDQATFDAASSAYSSYVDGVEADYEATEDGDEEEAESSSGGGSDWQAMSSGGLSSASWSGGAQSGGTGDAQVDAVLAECEQRGQQVVARYEPMVANADGICQAAQVQAQMLADAAQVNLWCANQMPPGDYANRLYAQAQEMQSGADSARQTAAGSCVN